MMQCPPRARQMQWWVSSLSFHTLDLALLLEQKNLFCQSTEVSSDASVSIKQLERKKNVFPSLILFEVWHQEAQRLLNKKSTVTWYASLSAHNCLLLPLPDKKTEAWRSQGLVQRHIASECLAYFQVSIFSPPWNWQNYNLKKKQPFKICFSSDSTKNFQTSHHIHIIELTQKLLKW